MKRKLLQSILGFEAKKIIGKYQPKVITITGSVGKTSTKKAISLLLEKYFTVWGGSGNLNTEFGVPLTFMGEKKGGGASFWEWFKIIISGFGLILIRRKDYPKVIVAEIGADKPGDISYLTGLVRPDISVVTMIGETPAHIGNYESLEQFIAEETKIVEILEEDSFAILNFDDPLVRNMKEKTKARVIYFGFGDGADVKIEGFMTETKKNNDAEVPYGVSFKLSFQGKSQRIHLPYCLGKPSAYSVAASFASGMVMGLNLDRAPDIFRDLRPEKGRMNLIEVNGCFILDDTYNASPVATISALETLSSLLGKRRIAVLGDMKELGERSISSHRQIGEMVSQTCNLLITIGDLAEEIKEGAINAGMDIEDTSHYATNKEVVDKLKILLQAGDLVLIKGSRSMGMEEIVKKIV